MAWIESHQELERHPKVHDLMSLMNWSLDETIGKLHRFWWWCVDYAENGDLRKHNDARLASAVGLNGDDGKKFVEAMVQSRWIDRNPYFRVHDWWDYVGRFLQSRYKHYPKKWKEIRKLYLNGSMNSSKHQTPNLTNLTIPNQKVLKPIISTNYKNQNQNLLKTCGKPVENFQDVKERVVHLRSLKISEQDIKEDILSLNMPFITEALIDKAMGKDY